MRALLVPALLACAAPLRGQPTCDAPHYRWPAKTSAEASTMTATKTTVGAMLNWDTLAVDGRDKFTCAPREGREKKMYSVTGWVRRVKTQTDGDWHIEITRTKGGTIDSCVVVEIAPAALDGNFAQARQDFELLAGLTVKASGETDLNPPVRLRFMGPAFFDGEHRRKAPNRTRGFNHGRCDLSLWEVHPVVWVKKP